VQPKHYRIIFRVLTKQQIILSKICDGKIFSLLDYVVPFRHLNCINKLYKVISDVANVEHFEIQIQN
jgi:hypothetical protein